MRQINFTYGDFYEAVENLHNIKSSVSYNSPSNVLLHIYVSNISLEQTEIITALLDSTMPDVPRIGITEFPVVNKNTPKNSVRINVLIAENSDFFPFQITCERGCEKDVAIAFLKQIKEIENIKGIEFCYANQLIDTVAFIDTIRNELKNIPIFGSLSKSADIVNGKIILNAASFSIGRKITTDGISAIVYCGENLSIDIKVLQSWRPIGRNLKIKLEENTMLGSTAISEIDNLPATDIFHKYLGVAIDENFLNHVWFFPLTVNRNSENICLIPTGYNGQTFYFNGRISKDESVNFAYCTQEDIIKDTYNETKKINDKTPEALFLNICNNRSAFMKEEESRELELFANCVKEFCFSHSFGEIAYQNEYSDILNSASVIIYMKESGDNARSSFDIKPKINEFENSTIADSYIVSHFFDEITRELIEYKNSLENEVEKISHNYKNLLLHIVQTLADTIDAKDRYTNGHSGRVAQYAKEISRRLGYSEIEQLDIYMIGLLHDVGKIGIPDDVINKHLKLTKDEYDCIKSHPNIGANILGNIKEMPSLKIGAKWHHERYDGRGYPDGLKGNDIPEIARIIAVADAYDAMTSNRVYRDALPQNIVRSEIKKGKNLQFDPVFADIMIGMIDDDKEYKMRETTQRKVDSLQKQIINDDEKANDDARHISFLQLVDFGRSMPGGFFVYKEEGGEELLYANDIVLEMFGCKDMNEFKTLTGFTFSGMVHEDDLERIENSIINQVNSNDKKLDYIEYRIRRKNGEIRWVDDYGRLVNTIEYGYVYFVLIRDITDQHNARKVLTETDHLTGAYNRRSFDKKIISDICNLLNTDSTLAMLMIDIDKFKNFNDQYGHLAGDQCLCLVAEAMMKYLRQHNNSLYRYGGEEFSVVLADMSFDNVLKTAEDLRESIRSLNISHENFEHNRITISIGVGFFDSSTAHALSDPTTQLIKLADEALYEAKTSGRDSVKYKIKNTS